mgnify:CR=1 FL=1
MIQNNIPERKINTLSEFVDNASHIIFGNPLVTKQEDVRQKKRPSRIKESPITGKITELYVSKSLAKQLQYQGNPKPICPYKIYHMELLRDITVSPSDPMVKGLYFESKTIGMSAGGGGTYDLPRHRTTGDKLVDHVRIDNAVDRFFEVSKELGMIIDPKYTQVHNRLKWIDETRNWDIDIFMEGTSDIFSPIHTPNYQFDVINIDLKLTKDRDSTFPPFGWGDTSNIDFFEAMIYRVLFELPFMYLIFDYRKDNPGYKDIPVVTDVNDSDPQRALKASNRMRDLWQTIRWIAGSIQMWEAEGWKKDPSFHEFLGKPVTPCKDCPIYDCEERSKTEPV